MVSDAHVPPARLDSLTSLRWCAALLVFLYHSAVLLDGSPASSFSRVLFGGGGSGVAFFFVLSGFVLAWSHRSGDTALRFYRRRFARIYPVYAVTLLVGFAFTLVSDPGALQHAWLTPLLLQAWVPDQAVVLAVNVPAWSLSCEAFFYLAFPLLIGPLLRSASRTRTVTAVVALVLIVAVGAAGAVLDAAGSAAAGQWLVGYFPLPRLLEFVIGIVLALQLRVGRLPRVPFPLAAILAVGAVLGASVLHSPLGVVALPIVPFSLLIVAAAQIDLARRPTWLRAPLFITLGSWSYAFYLVHVLVIGAVSTGLAAVGLPNRGAPVIALVFALSLLGAALLHVVVEKPLDRLLNGRGARPSVVADR